MAMLQMMTSWTHCSPNQDQRPHQLLRKEKLAHEDDSDDELDALLSENHPVQPGAENAKTASISKASAFEAGPDEDELDALMNEQGPTHAPDAAASAAGSTRPKPWTTLQMMRKPWRAWVGR
ncbi:hypothetical protein HII31_01903 [Pseudocercospora fuligena]|uniref:Uncharacterized protein n=1 Tax=Pseudocercospora fuligena TaxID=685502 RepID=A0A8H6RSN7_9PEZI|nr:hypothetical protein HII31_01903 [Pseudocercospora fuligena]